MIKTIRAGASKGDLYSSGYVRSVDIIGQEDLFPSEGYAFPPGKTKLTNSYRVSRDSPFSTHLNVPLVHHSDEDATIERSRPSLIRLERLCTRTAAAAISSPTDGELRPLHSRIAEQAVLKERKAQLALKEDLRLARMRDEMHWADVERLEAETSKALVGEDERAKRAAEQGLAAVYNRELELHAAAKAEEARLEQEEAEKLTKEYSIAERKEREAREAKKAESRARAEESRLGNSGLLERKARERDEARAEEDRIAREHAELEEQQQQREARVKKARADKDGARERIISAQVRRLAAERAGRGEDEVTDSQVERNKVAAIKKEEERVSKMRQEEAQGWKEFCLQKDEKLVEDKKRRLAPEELPPDARENERQAEERMRRIGAKRLQGAQLQQIAERKAREAEEAQRNREGSAMFFLKDEDE
jgi:hypothetical protein